MIRVKFCNISNFDHIISAVLITGGDSYGARQSAEIYHPNRGSPCIITNIPDERKRHSLDGLLMCGGIYFYYGQRKTCRRWTPDTGAWDLVTKTLTGERSGHISWTPADGSVTYLIGGYDEYHAADTSDILQHDNNKVSTSPSFPLKHKTS